VEKKIDGNLKYDYDHVLPIFSQTDTALAKTYEEEIEEAIKMASLAIQRHQISKWVDDSYILIGLARFYSLDYENAIKTFKYVNTKSEDDNARHEALIHLLRVFTDYGEYTNAVAVSDYLKKEKLNNKNKKALFLNRAYYYQQKGELNNMISSLVEAEDFLSRKDGRGKIYFIMGQIYHELGFYAEAYNYYKKCLSTNPAYEFEFFSRLNMAQVRQITSNSDVKSVRKDFEKLLKDKKNVEFKDKIYYEMAGFELKQDNVDGAIDYYKKSVQSSVNNNRQKGLAYLQMGIINYDSLKKYELASAYYDSAVRTLPRTEEGFENIEQRQKILSRFVVQLNTIRVQDSLLNLAGMDSLKLRAYLAEYVETENEKSANATVSGPRAVSTSAYRSPFESGGSSISSNWYFGNPSAMAQGQNDFIQKWGDIILEDHWRRSNKEQTIGREDERNKVSKNDNASVNPTISKEIPVEESVNALLATIPFTKSKKTEALGQVEEAYYELGKIYHFDLEESLNAAESFEILLDRFDSTSHRPEVMYLLYLIYKDAGRNEFQKYRSIILSEYGNSTYAKLILNPNYTRESGETVEKLKVLYAQAYSLYDKGYLDSAKVISVNALSTYPDIQFSTRFKLLNVLITGKTENIVQYQYELSEFIKKNPDSDLRPYAQKLLDASREFEEKQRKAAGIKFIEFFEQEHYFIILYPAKDKLTNTVTKALEEFNAKNFPTQKLNISSLIFNDEYHMTMVSEFPGAKSSIIYNEYFTLDKGINDVIPLNKARKFVITKDNFTIFYQTKELDGYIRFHQEFYD
ncbi:MAG: methyltransferase, partial [Cyclobacteriaceae bacterium]|nr:methyltransferase [Cyclobacteriaceae bacterium]